MTIYSRVKNATQPQERMIDCGTASLRVFDWGGDGTAVLLGHAHTSDAEGFAPLASLLKEQGFRPISYNRRGYAGSTRGSDYASATQGSDALQLLDALQLPSVHAVGCAAGGGAIADLIRIAPDRIEQTVMVCSLVARPAPEWIGPGESLIDHRADPRDVELSDGFRAAFPDSANAWAQKVYDARELGAGEPPQPYTAAFDPNILASLNDRLLLVGGAEDKLLTPEMFSRMRQLWPQASSCLMEGIAHCPALEAPQETARIITGFLHSQD